MSRWKRRGAGDLHAALCGKVAIPSEYPEMIGHWACYLEKARFPLERCERRVCNRRVFGPWITYYDNCRRAVVVVLGLRKKSPLVRRCCPREILQIVGRMVIRDVWKHLIVSLATK